ncbi:hypothetical protein [Streptomyces sp. NBC_00154]|uniref:hypothetical protein n=1 Tax=Streptomyces sp. NBC_00154 TaxID=2975670 RepID=UPI00225B96D4|nr:hypothetical protein [Streptomyces sp. NBC_00154]MCX5317333.1 hypothetical protein [Streptomyces sp. NBC_00154]
MTSRHRSWRSNAAEPWSSLPRPYAAARAREIVERCARSARGERRGGTGNQLPPRKVEVVRLMLQGLANRQRVLVHAGPTVRDQQHRTTRHLRRRRHNCHLRGELFGHPVPGPFGDGEFVALGPHLLQLPDQLVFQLVQFRASHRDPFCDPGLHHGTGS